MLLVSESRVYPLDNHGSANMKIFSHPCKSPEVDYLLVLLVSAMNVAKGNPLTALVNLI